MKNHLIATYTLPFSKIGLSQVNEVGGKNASLGEMFNQLLAQGITVPDGFATTAQAYYDFLNYNQLYVKIQTTLAQLNTHTFANLPEVGAEIREMLLTAKLPPELEQSVRNSFRDLKAKYPLPIQVAVRSSATAEDLPTASFAGQHESFLNITTEDQLLRTCIRCYASLFKDRAIKYRHDHHFDHMKVALSIGVQKMVRSDLGSSGVCFTLDPDSGFSDVVVITGGWGLGENIVQGAINPDEFVVFKTSLQQGKQAILSKKLASKAYTMVYADSKKEQTIVNVVTPEEKQNQFVLSNEEIHQLARWSLAIEAYYQQPMDIEWAKDGQDGHIYVVQARPETIHSQKKQRLSITEYTLTSSGKLLTAGKGIGHRIVSGTARIIQSPKDPQARLLKPGDILVTDITNPDWDPILKKVSAIVTNRGGRTSHAAIVARELGALAVVGTTRATEVITDGSQVTVVCTDGQNGQVYDGKLTWREEQTDMSALTKPHTQAMLILGDPDQAFRLAQYPNDGVGLMRLEFAINNAIGIHPMALARFHTLKDPEVRAEIEKRTQGYARKEEFFVEKLAQAVATVAAAFYPRPVIVRMSDFKTNEYANLLGGRAFEPSEENPMLGFRGASRYYDPRYADGFVLECKAMHRVRTEMGLTNVKLMIPFCRTVEEGKNVLSLMAQHGLKRGVNGLQVYVMAEIPSNILLASSFAAIFDGFSIGSNDLTQLTLGVDRDTSSVHGLFNENDEAVKYLIAMLIRAAHQAGKPVGICGQAPSDSPAFAQFLVEQGIDSVSFNPDAFLKGLLALGQAEKKGLAMAV